MTNPVPVIAIDGPGGSGKGVISQRLSEHLGFHLLDSGALYRVVGVAAQKHGISTADEAALAKMTEILDIRFKTTGNQEQPVSVILDGKEITADIRSDQAGVNASKVARLPAVRQALQGLQHSFRRPPGLVADGRDMGTIVFADAGLKIFLTATPEERAERRYKQLKDKDIGVSLLALLDSIRERDARDMNRTVAPLVPAKDAVIIDSTGISIDEVLSRVLSEATNRGITGTPPR
jgi:cytidylate kinase